MIYNNIHWDTVNGNLFGSYFYQGDRNVIVASCDWNHLKLSISIALLKLLKYFSISLHQLNILLLYIIVHWKIMQQTVLAIANKNKVKKLV